MQYQVTRRYEPTHSPPGTGYRTLVARITVLVVLAVALTPLAVAAAGDLDPSFGSGGSVRTDFGGSEEIRALAIQPDGKLVAAGSITWPASWRANPPEPTDVLLARYHPDGSPDSTFGSEGWVVTDFDGGYDVAEALVIQPDGKLVVGGWSGRRGTSLTSEPAEFVLARYQPDGSLDPEFGTNGRVMTSFGGHDMAQALVLQLDGKLVLVGNNHTPAYFTSVALARYTPDGRLDPTFATEGRLVTNFGFDGAVASALVRQSDGTLVVAGTVWVTRRTRPDLLLARFAPDGSLDPQFGTGGVVTTDFGEHEAVEALALQPDGRLLVAGLMGRSEGQGEYKKYPALARYTADGVLDTEFGEAGRMLLDIGGHEYAYALALTHDGKLVLAGGAGVADSSLSPDFLVVRLRENGTPDDSFGIGGRVVTDLGAPYEWANALAIQPDGKPVVGGYTPGTTPHAGYVARRDFVLVRYLAE